MGDQASQLSAQEHGQKMEQQQGKSLAEAGADVLVKSLERAQVKEEQPQFSGDLGDES
jgi:hypothetical protein